jgi:hypothetical protein
MSQDPEPLGDRVLSQGQGDRFDRWVEFFGALVLSAATVLTAWCAYQATLWGGDQSVASYEAAAAQIQATRYHNEALVKTTLHVTLFVQYVTAKSQENEKLADFLVQRFPPELKTAVDAWLATNPLKDPTAPKSPFSMAEYHLPEQDLARQAEQLSAVKQQASSDANDRSDRYVLLTVIFAMVLFFSGISGKFQWRVIDAAVLIAGVVVLVVGVAMVIRMPIE